MKVRYTTSCSTANLSNIRAFVGSKLKEETVLADCEMHKIILAIDEACANAIIHGNNCDEKRQLQVDMDLNEDTVSVEIYDVGNYQPNKKTVFARSIEDCIQNKQKGGLGLRIIHRVMDTVRYFNRDNTNVCMLTKKLKQK